MATLRKANSYSKKNVTPFTRNSSIKNKAYIKTIPPQSITKFTMGNNNLSKLKHHLTLVSCEKVQIRHNAIEACRRHLHKELEEKFPGQFYFKIIPYPHQIQRENKMITGAGADRMQTGMQLSFGKSIGKAAVVKPGDRIFFIAVPNEKAVIFTRKIIKQLKPKLPCRTRVDYKFLA